MYIFLSKYQCYYCLIFNFIWVIFFSFMKIGCSIQLKCSPEIPSICWKSAIFSEKYSNRCCNMQAKTVRKSKLFFFFLNRYCELIPNLLQYLPYLFTISPLKCARSPFQMFECNFNLNVGHGIINMNAK